MKYGLAFLVLAVLLASSAATRGGLAWLLVYPVFSFTVVGLAYASSRHDFFGKRPDGTLSLIAVLSLMRSATFSPAAQLPVGKPAERLILHVDMDARYAAVEQRDRREL